MNACASNLPGLVIWSNWPLICFSDSFDIIVIKSVGFWPELSPTLMHLLMSNNDNICTRFTKGDTMLSDDHFMSVTIKTQMFYWGLKICFLQFARNFITQWLLQKFWKHMIRRGQVGAPVPCAPSDSSRAVCVWDGKSL